MKKLINDFKKETLSILLFSGITAALRVLPSLMLTFATNAILKKDLYLFITWDLLIIAAWLLFILSDYLYSVYEEKQVQTIAAYLRGKEAQTLSKLSPMTYQQQTTGAYVSRLTNDITMIENSGIKSLYQIFSNVWLVIFSAVALLFFSPWLLAAALLLSTLLLLLPTRFQKGLTLVGENVAVENEAFTNQATDLLGGYRVLLYAHKLTLLKEKIIKANQNLATAKIAATKEKTRITNTIGLLSLLCQVAIDVITGILIILGMTTFGAISSAGNLAANIFNAISIIGELITEVITVQPLISRFYREVPANRRQPLTSFEEGIQIHDLRFGYQSEKPILNQLSFAIKKGKKYALIGKSGSGKSTLLRILAGELENYTGSITIDGQPLSKIDPYPVMQYIDQSVYLFQDTFRHNISLWDAIDDTEITNAITRADATFINDLDETVTEGGENLSGGQRQRIALARSFLEKKKIMLIDEGTSALDKEAALKIENLLLKDPELTVVMITHHLHEENRHAFDEIIQLN